MNVSVSVNRPHAASSIQDAYWTCREDQRDGTRRAALYCHPNNATMQFIAGNVGGVFDGQRALIHAAANAGYTVGGSDLGFVNGTTGNGSLGNPASQTRVGELDAWSKLAAASGGLGGATLPRVVFSCSAGYMAAANYFGKSPGHAADLAALVIILPPFDLANIYANDLGGLRASVEYSLGITYPAPLPAGASPKDNTALLNGKPIRIYYASDDPLNGTSVVADMLTAYGVNASAVNLGALGHTEAAIAAIDKTELLAWLASVAPAK